MKFPYIQIGSNYIPLIPITLSMGDRCIVTEALVDSGATKSIFDAQFAHALGIDSVEDGNKELFEGVSGHTLTGYRHRITIEVGGNKFDDKEISFSKDMPDNAVNILGQQGFFEICPIKFTYAKREIEIMTGSIVSKK